MLRKVAFTMYPVTDMPRARAFYEETLGLPPSSYGAQSPWNTCEGGHRETGDTYFLAEKYVSPLRRCISSNLDAGHDDVA